MSSSTAATVTDGARVVVGLVVEFFISAFTSPVMVFIKVWSSGLPESVPVIVFFIAVFCAAVKPDVSNCPKMASAAPDKPPEVNPAIAESRIFCPVIAPAVALVAAPVNDLARIPVGSILFKYAVASFIMSKPGI